MNTKLCALLLLLTLPLAGCSSMLNREYAMVVPHKQSLTTGQDPSTLEAETYQDLVSAVLYLVTQHDDSGTVRLYNYTGDVDTDLTAACLEVVQKDPLGAYAVDYIKHDVSRIVSYYEANVTITYRRTAEEMGNIVSVTGSSAIKSELRDTLSQFGPETTLRISYFAEDGDYIRNLIAQAYYDTPGAAFGLPEVAVSLYPEAGIQRIVEIGLTYPAQPEVLAELQGELSDALNTLLPEGRRATSRYLYDLLLKNTAASSDPALNTAYAALLGGSANDEGLALAYKLLCDRAGLTCTVVRGTGKNGPRFWNIVTTESGSRHVDCSRSDCYGLTDAQLTELGGYQWESSYPLCRDSSKIPNNT